ncbi:hypothetical protein SAMN05444972_106135 [Marininema halotolerans]|uniref:Uncharacterized protein n=1 Tax=Marininema halotolerans TaxID=1155944 RepID=A0A1I6S495_9BACL|nr:hypothetical protein SAMN05444972_106135 [Marininema halotolerans]
MNRKDLAIRRNQIEEAGSVLSNNLCESHFFSLYEDRGQEIRLPPIAYNHITSLHTLALQSLD